MKLLKISVIPPWYESYRQQIENELSLWFEHNDCFPKNSPESTLFEAMKYGVLSSGKRFRPILGMCSFEACSKRFPQGKELQSFLALECIHAFTLIHDDLPAMDNDELRRGKPTVWKQFGEAIAILAGNALVGEAFWILSETVPHEKLQKTISLVSHTLRVQGVNGGQARDILLENRQNTPEDTEETHRKKTGALIRCSALLGGILANASQEQEQYLLQYADSLGLAFQIRDDILDAEGNAETLGKATGKDVTTKGFVQTFGLAQAKERLQKEIEIAQERATLLKSEKLADIAKFAGNREK